MSAGLQLLRSVIDNGSRDAFRSLRPEYFIENEQPVWTFVSSYFDQYGALPSLEICAQNNFFLPDAQGPIHYFRDSLRNRTIYNVYIREQQGLFDMIQRGDMMGFVVHIENMIREMRSVESRRDTFSLSEAIQSVMDDYLIARRSSGLRGVTYGWDELDDCTGGARPGDLHSIVARPGQGKSFTLARMACMAWQAGASVAFVSMEMTAIETARRIIAMGTGINADFIQRGHVSSWGEEQLYATVERLRDMPPFTLLVGDLSKSVRDVDAIIQEHEPDAIYVDAGYLLKPTRQGNQTKRFELVSDTIRELRSLSMSRHKPIIQTVQFNRSQKANEEMSLDNIGQSDEIGQLSALVLGMKKGSSPYEDTRRKIKVLKNRHGPDHFDFEIKFEHTPFCMDSVNQTSGAGTDDNGDYDGTQGVPPSQTEWTI